MTLIRDHVPPIDPHAVLPDRCLKATNVPDRPCCLNRCHRGKTSCLPFPSRWAVRLIDAENPRWRALPTQRTGGGHVHGAWCHPSAEGCPDDIR